MNKFILVYFKDIKKKIAFLLEQSLQHKKSEVSLLININFFIDFLKFFGILIIYL